MNLSALIRSSAHLRPKDLLRAGSGALFGVVATGLLARAVMNGGFEAAPLLVPPIGASAVLVFAVPASPLAQPRAVLGGNIVSAVVGVSCALLIPQPALAAGAAVAAAIVAMTAMRCLHPPGGAVALGAVLAGASGLESYIEIGGPIALCSALLIGTALVYVNLTGRSYPHRVAHAVSPHATRDPPPDERVGYTPGDVDRALAQYGELLDVSREDLDALFREVELQAHRRLHAEILCVDIMSRDVVAVEVGQSAASALALLREHDLRIAPLVDERRRVIGVVRRAELAAAGDGSAEAALDPEVRKVRPGTAIEALLPLLSSGRAHEAVVVDDEGVLVGIVTQTDLLAALYRAHIVEAVVGPSG